MELKQRKFINNIPQFDVGKNAYTNWVDTNRQGGINSTNQAKSRWSMYEGYGVSTPQQRDILDATTRSINNPNAGYNDLDETPTLKQQPSYTSQTTVTSTSDDMSSDVGLLTDSKSSTSGFGGKAGMIGNIAQMGNQDIVAWYNHVFHQPKAGQILSEAGTTNANVMGYGYQRINDIDEASYKRREKEQAVGGTLNAVVHGASTGMQTGGLIGAIVGGVAGLAGGVSAHILGSKNLKEELTYANNLKNRLNIFNRSGAMTQAKQDYYYTNKGYTLDDVLYANRGKDLKRPIL